MSVITDDAKNRYVMYPILHREAFDFYKKHLATFWTAEEIDLTVDVKEFRDKLNAKERHFIKVILAFFAASDGIVLENLALRFYRDVPVAEVRAFYAVQMMMETVHSETYSLLIDTLVQDSEKDELFDALNTYPCVAAKAKWAIDYIQSASDFTQRLAAFIIVEGVFFSSSFCAIFWLKKRGLMPGLAFSNELISRDEGLHCDFGVFLFKNYAKTAGNKETIHRMFREAVDVELAFVDNILPDGLFGMNAAAMKTYVRFVANRLLVQMGMEPLFGSVKNPFEFMDLISLRGKTNFFERRVSEYAKARVLNNDKTLGSFSMDADF